MRIDTGQAGASATESDGIGSRFDAAMRQQDGRGTGDIAEALSGIANQMQALVQQLAQLIQAMRSDSQSGASLAGATGRTRPVEGSGGPLGGEQGPSERIPDPTQDVRQVRLGARTMTIGSNGTASTAEVDAAARELQRMYDVSPTFRSSIDSTGSDGLTVTLGRRGDNTSWGGGARVFLNLNDIEAGNNDRFQGIVGHEFAHASNGLDHGPALDAIEARVRAEA